MRTSISGEQNSWRFRLVEVFFILTAALIVGQIIRIQVSPQAEIFRKQGRMYAGEWHTLEPVRGQIYDRWGHLLAGNTIVYEVGVELKDVVNPETIAITLSSVLQKDYDIILGAVSQPYSLDAKNMAVYVVVDKDATQEEIDRLERIREEISNQPPLTDKNQTTPSLRGVVVTPRLKRSYPEGQLASNIIGFVNANGEGYGLEKKLNDLLAGNQETVFIPLDPLLVADIPEAPVGASLVLTIDRDIQVAMEKILDRAVDSSGSENGALVVMDPETGEILAMASTPRIDLNDFANYARVFPGTTAFNKAVGEAYEPGSVFKVLTMAAALDAGAVTPNTEFYDPGVFEIGGIYIYNWNSGAWGVQNMTGCMQHSLNVCLAWTATQLGADRFYRYMGEFGFGHLTGIELEGEDAGRLKQPGDDDWYDADLGTNSFGQGISATPIQMLMAISSIANDGKMMAPHILHSTVNNNRQYPTSQQVVGHPVSAETAHTLTDMLATSLEIESSDALVEGYRVAGKTGTGEIPTQYGYTSNLTNASFVGWGPVDDPKFLVYVWLEKPTESPWGSVVAAPVFREAVEQLVLLMGLPPDAVREELGVTYNP